MDVHAQKAMDAICDLQGPRGLDAGVLLMID